MFTELDALRDAAWLYVALPLALLAALVATYALGAPQLRRLGDAFRGLREHDASADGETTPSAATWLAAAAAMGAASTVGAATAVSLGGAGALFWVWIIGFVLAPLRYAEVVLARTNPPGKSDAGRAASLVGRLARQRGVARSVGLALFALAALTAFAFVGGVHGGALRDLTASFYPSSTPAIGYGVAALAAFLALVGAKRGATIAGWVALAALVALALAALGAALTDPGRAFGAIGRAFGEAFGGAPEATPFTGALAGEIVVATLLHVAPPVFATTGTVGALHSAARAKATKRQAAVAMLGPLVFAAVTTFVMMAIVATGTFFRRVDDARPFTDVTVLAISFESTSQRLEPERLHTGYMRIIDGEARDLQLSMATERAMIASPRYTFRGRPADVALQIEAGKAFRILRPRDGTLTEVPASEIAELFVEGEMLPRGSRLLGETLESGAGGSLTGRLLFTALLLLLVAGAGSFGMALARSLPGGLPSAAGLVVGSLPAAGLALATAGVAPWLEPVGGLAAAAVTAVGALVLAWKAREAR